MIGEQKLLVISAHAADYVWRAGGTIAKYIDGKAQVEVIVLSFGVRGESNDLWKQPGQTAEGVKAIRREETGNAAKLLGITGMEFWDIDDYPLARTGLEDRLTEKIRKFRPTIIITHDKFDIMNPDHNTVSEAVFSASVMSNSSGVIVSGTQATTQMKIFGFEPHQTELSRFVPNCFVDITSAYERKIEAMKCFKAQSHLIEYYTQRAFMRGNHARRLSGNNAYKYAESFASVFPYVGEGFF